MRPRPSRRPDYARAGRQRGFSLVELMIVLTILTVGIAMLAGTLGAVMRLGPTQRESARALAAARSRLEEVRAAPFNELFVRFNADPADDPGGAGTAPGSNFAVPGLSPQPGDADGMVGEVVFPTIGGQLREDVVDLRFGTPRDLNQDGTIDPFDHSADYRVLPVRVRLRWQNADQARTIELQTTVVGP